MSTNVIIARMKDTREIIILRDRGRLIILIDCLALMGSLHLVK